MRLPIADMPQLLASGQITHALVWAAYLHYDLWKKAGSAALSAFTARNGLTHFCL